MENLSQELVSLLQKNSIIEIALTLILLVTYGYISLLILRKPTLFFRAIKAMINRFLGSVTYSEASNDREYSLEGRISDLEIKLSNLSHKIDKQVIHGNEDQIRVAVQQYLEDNLRALIKSKIEELKTQDQEVFSAIEVVAEKEVTKYLLGLDLTEVVNEAVHLQSLQRKRAEERMLDEISEEQLRNSGRIKTVMMNLFVIFNLGLVMFYLLGDAAKLVPQVTYGILGLYVSLAAFIIYVYRASNARSSVVMAIREDSKKYHDVMGYLSRFRPNGDISEQDVDLLRMLMTNRSEREKGTDHPYEMIFKSVANSNIQFKGGKMSIEKEASSAKK